MLGYCCCKFSICNIYFKQILGNTGGVFCCELMLSISIFTVRSVFSKLMCQVLLGCSIFIHARCCWGFQYSHMPGAAGVFNIHTCQVLLGCSIFAHARCCWGVQYSHMPGAAGVFNIHPCLVLLGCSTFTHAMCCWGIQYSHMLGVAGVFFMSV